MKVKQENHSRVRPAWTDLLRSSEVGSVKQINPGGDCGGAAEAQNIPFTAQKVECHHRKRKGGINNIWKDLRVVWCTEEVEGKVAPAVLRAAACGSGLVEALQPDMKWMHSMLCSGRHRAGRLADMFNTPHEGSKSAIVEPEQEVTRGVV